jgi:hypothetical protein
VGTVALLELQNFQVGAPIITAWRGKKRGWPISSKQTTGFGCPACRKWFEGGPPGDSEHDETREFSAFGTNPTNEAIIIDGEAIFLDQLPPELGISASSLAPVNISPEPQVLPGNDLTCPGCGILLRLNGFVINADWNPIAKAWRGW